MNNYVALEKVAQELPLGEGMLKIILKEAKIPWVRHKLIGKSQSVCVHKRHVLKLKNKITALALQF